MSFACCNPLKPWFARASRCSSLKATLLRLTPLIGAAACAAGLTGAESASLRVEGARVTIVAPDGLCIDPDSPDVGRAGGTLLISDCALVRNVPPPERPLNGVISVSISTAGLEGDLNELEEFLRGPGISGLSRTQNGLNVTILDSRRTNRALFLKIRDVSPSERRGPPQDFWRVFFEAGPRLVTGSIVAFRDLSVPDTRALALLSDLENRTTAANPRPSARPTVVEVPALDPEVEEKETPLEEEDLPQPPA